MIKFRIAPSVSQGMFCILILLSVPGCLVNPDNHYSSEEIRRLRHENAVQEQQNADAERKLDIDILGIKDDQYRQLQEAREREEELERQRKRAEAKRLKAEAERKEAERMQASNSSSPSNEIVDSGPGSSSSHSQVATSSQQQPEPSTTPNPILESSSGRSPKEEKSEQPAVTIKQSKEESSCDVMLAEDLFKQTLGQEPPVRIGKLKKLLQKCHNNPRYHIALARAFQDANELPNARSVLEKMLKEWPDNSEAQRLLEQILKEEAVGVSSR